MKQRIYSLANRQAHAVKAPVNDRAWEKMQHNSLNAAFRCSLRSTETAIASMSSAILTASGDTYLLVGRVLVDCCSAYSHQGHGSHVCKNFWVLSPIILDRRFIVQATCVAEWLNNSWGTARCAIGRLKFCSTGSAPLILFAWRISPHNAAFCILLLFKPSCRHNEVLAACCTNNHRLEPSAFTL